MPTPDRNQIVIIGAGPAGLMAAESALASGARRVSVYDRMGSVARKFLIAGKGGLNLTHSEPFEQFITRFRPHPGPVADWLRQFDADAMRAWAAGLGVETFVGSSGRVFPHDLKAAPLLRAWVRRLRTEGVQFHVNHDWLGWNGNGDLRFVHDGRESLVNASATVLALGGGSWPVLGSNAAWVPLLRERGIEVTALQAANCGFDVGWSRHLASRFAGAPIKPVAMTWTDPSGTSIRRQGEFVLTETGIEGSLVYALSAGLREAIVRDGTVQVHLDLAPLRDHARLQRDLAKPRGSHSMSKHLHRHAGIDGAKSALLHEILKRDVFDDPARLAQAIKALPLRLLRPRPIEEAISSAGGVALSAVDENLMLRAMPGVFCAGEMLDWEAPTGGYLLTASMAGGFIAGAAAAARVNRD
ncbi:MAG: TIGR03862 family flavoprotein [Elusimicrobia bacterium]|nr:MAG: TIGR03862 family flavoprotein [Gammaproteobacteria bacterium]TXH21265.1 MAG: TIGR03862 family flavoprotein [Elusimicrobiota bacterium]